jgi:hypothetical protein
MIRDGGGAQSAKLFLKSSELGLPHPLTRRRVCPPPSGSGGGGGTHLLAGPYLCPLWGGANSRYSKKAWFSIPFSFHALSYIFVQVTEGAEGRTAVRPSNSPNRTCYLSPTIMSTSALIGKDDTFLPLWFDVCFLRGCEISLWSGGGGIFSWLVT